jgi:hypothetical protein
MLDLCGSQSTNNEEYSLGECNITQYCTASIFRVEEYDMQETSMK